MMLKHMTVQDMDPIRYGILVSCLPIILDKGLGTDILNLFEQFKKDVDTNSNQVKFERTIPIE